MEHDVLAKVPLVNKFDLIQTAGVDLLRIGWLLPLFSAEEIQEFFRGVT